MSASLAIGRQQLSGFYVWDVGSDLVFSCEGTAKLFGLEPSAAHRGLPVSSFFDLIHPDDRERMREATLAGTEGVFRYQYRIVRAPDDGVTVRTVGCRFADGRGSPIRHVGTIAALDGVSADVTIDIIDHCLAAYELAQGSGKPMMQYLIGMALLEAGFDVARSR
ncbi:PAS domain-containing protein [Aureimonas leprariae]|uniref:PAS domain-containing protein n=1 Tax=Plantimonas leprariae TaxID=2615207 RepID=UPI001386B492|nr:PAS domain-containing protein [Aureimonas leprariae]